MMKRTIIISIALVLIIFQSMASAAMRPVEFITLCYHAVPLRAVPGNSFSVPQKKFVEQMEYLRTHGYHPISFDDVVKAHKGEKELPEKAVLLTFDDGYISYYDFVVPVLAELGYPSVLAVVGNFIEYTAPKGLPEPLMTWEQIKELSSRRLVEVVSHTYNMHQGIQYNPQGNVAAAASVVAFDPETKAYETEEEYRARLKADFISQEIIFMEKMGFVPRVIVWPYGRFNQISLDVAKKTGIEFTFTLEEGYSSIENLDVVNRNLVENLPIEHFIKMMKNPYGEKPFIRAIQVDLDLIYDPDEQQMDLNLGKLIDRLVAMDVNTVFLQAFADPEGRGNIKSVYFDNSVLPVRADFFSHAVHQMAIRAMKVYAWMPALSIELPDTKLNEKLKVRELRDGSPVQSSSWYRRLSPFSSDTAELFRRLYKELASHSQIHGVLFQDDAYLTDHEDFHPAALAEYKKRFGRDLLSENFDDASQHAEEWSRHKTLALIDYTKTLMEGVREYRPVALFARNLYGIVMEEPRSELWFAQDYELFLRNYDYVVVMAYPEMEKVADASQWLHNLVDRAKAYPQGLEKTVFKIQAYDWRREEWIKDRVLLEEMRDVLASGGRHLAYYPDNVWKDRPALKTIKLEMSSKTYPFIP